MEATHRKLVALRALSLVAVLSLTGCGILHSIMPDDKESPEETAKKTAARTARYEENHASFIATSCEQFPAAFDAQFDCCGNRDPEALSYDRKREMNLEVAAHFVECGQWPEFFHRVARFFPKEYEAETFRGAAIQERSVLTRLAETEPVLERLNEFLASGKNVFDGRGLGSHSGGAVAGWLTYLKDPNACTVIANNIGAISPDSVPHFGWFFFYAECAKESTPFAYKNLASSDWRLRHQACGLIGKFGTAKDTAKLDLLANNDPHLKPAERLSNGQYFPPRYLVREQCAFVSNKLKLQ